MPFLNFMKQRYFVKKIAVIITTPPFSNLTVTALNYIETALNTGVEIIGVFFYQDAVLNASSHIRLANDEYQTTQQWLKLHNKYQLPLHLCVTAAEKRGLTDCNSVQLIANSFTISGLGELVELNNKADTVVQF
jgi:tRNA 2-thiouridine synthesizing protein D